VRLFLIIWIIYAVALSLALVRRTPRRKHARQPAQGWGNRWKILIVGATGGTGLQLVKQALDLGHQVTALVRKPEKLNIQHPNLRVIKGNVLDYESVKSAATGQNAVVSALGHKRWFYPSKILSAGTRNILRAMKECKVPRFICESSLGVGSSVGRLGLLYIFLIVPLILPFYLWDKVRQEKLIEESEADWVIVRPGVLKNLPSRGKYRHGHNVGNFIWTVRVSRADVADFMLKQLTDDAYVGTAVGVAW
jgi:putative NADH-flavin reductase